MVHNQIRHHGHVCAQRAHVAPRAEARIDERVIDWVESRVGAVNRVIKREHVHATKQTAELLGEQAMKLAHVAATEAIGVGDELDLVFHGERGRRK